MKAPDGKIRESNCANTEGADQSVTKCNALKMPAADGRGIERLKITEL